MVVQDIQASLRELVDLGGSDLHLKVGAPPRFRIDGALQDAPGAAVLETDDTEAALLALLPEPSRREEFAAENEVDFSFDIPGSGRFRVNAFRQRGTTHSSAARFPTTSDRSKTSTFLRRSARSPRKSAASFCSPARPARESRRRSRR